MNRRGLQPKAKARVAKFRLLVIFMAISLLIGSVTAIQGGDIYDYVQDGFQTGLAPGFAAYPQTPQPVGGIVGAVAAKGYTSGSTSFEWEWRKNQDCYLHISTPTDKTLTFTAE